MPSSLTISDRVSTRRNRPVPELHEPGFLLTDTCLHCTNPRESGSTPVSHPVTPSPRAVRAPAASASVRQRRRGSAGQLVVASAGPPVVAVALGFEPRVAMNHTDFRDLHLRPLGHATSLKRLHGRRPGPQRGVLRYQSRPTSALPQRRSAKNAVRRAWDSWARRPARTST